MAERNHLSRGDESTSRGFPQKTPLPAGIDNTDKNRSSALRLHNGVFVSTNETWLASEVSMHKNAARLSLRFARSANGPAGPPGQCRARWQAQRLHQISHGKRMLDIYCERLSADFWAEPVNALTNLAFVVAAISGWRLYRQHPSAAPASAWLVVVVAMIGVGSFLFHTFATAWAVAADVLPILVFQIGYLWVYGRQVIQWRRTTGLVVVVLFVTTILVSGQFGEIANGSLAYAPAAAVLAWLAIFHTRTAQSSPHTLLMATVLFLLSLTFRTLDEALCAAVPLGTHFLWHLLNSVVLYLAMRGLIVESAARSVR